MSDTVTPAQALAALAAEVYAKHGVGATAVAVMRKKIRSARQLEFAAIEIGCATLLSHSLRRERVQLAAPTVTNERSGAESEADVNTIMRESPAWWGWKMSDGKPICRATKEDLGKQIEYYRSHIAGCQRELRFLERIERRLKPGQAVDEVLRPHEVQRYYDITHKVESESLSAA